MLFPQNSFSSKQEFLNLLSDISNKQISYTVDSIQNIIIQLSSKNIINKHLTDYQIKNLLLLFKDNGTSFIHHDKVINNDEQILFEVDFLTNEKFYDNVFVISLKELIQNCPAIDKGKVSEMIQTHITKKINSNKNNNVIEEGLDDWLQRNKDTRESNKINKEYDSYSKSKDREINKFKNNQRIETNKLKNDALNQMINTIENHLEQNGASWNNLYKILKKMGLKNDSILRSFIKLMDSSNNEPSYKIISTLSKDLVNKSDPNYNDEQKAIKSEDREKIFDSNLRDLIEAFRAQYTFSDKNLLLLIQKLKKDDIIDNNPEKLINMCFQRANLSQDTIDKFRKEEVDLDYQLNQELENQNNQSKDETKTPNQSIDVKSKLSDLISALRNQGYSKTQALQLTKKISPEDLKTKSIQDLYLIAMKSVGDSILNQNSNNQ